MWLLLNHGAMTDGRDPSTFYKLYRYFANYKQYITASLKVELRHTKYLHHESCISNTENTCLLMNHRSVTNEKYSFTFYKMLGPFVHNLHCIKDGPPP
jgi:hypothetical protein